MKNTRPFLAACVVVLPYCFGQKDIRWYVNNTNPVAFCGDVTLHCHTYNHDCSGHRRWAMGKTILAINEYPTQWRYTTNIQSSFFDLTIRNFWEDDIGKNYTCVCGLLTYTKQLVKGEINLLLIPRNETIIDSSSIVNGILLLNITLMEVYPAPECNITFCTGYKYTLPCDSQMINVVTEKTCVGYYQANLAYKYKLPTCSGHITAICTVSKYTTKVYKRYFDNCTVPFMSITEFKVAFVIGVITEQVVAIVIVVIFCKHRVSITAIIVGCVIDVLFDFVVIVIMVIVVEGGALLPEHLTED